MGMSIPLVSDLGHHYQFGPPKGGWPDFTKKGKLLTQKKKKQAYIAGPMRGYPLYNFPAFDQAVGVVERETKYKAISPAQMDRDTGFDPADPADFTEENYHEAMRRDFAVLMDPNTKAIIMLPEWYASTGAKAELTVAINIGLKVYEILCLKTDWLIEIKDPAARLQEAYRLV